MQYSLPLPHLAGVAFNVTEIVTAPRPEFPVCKCQSAGYDSQGQVPSEARHVAPGKAIRFQGEH
jgi:hypothetical protein